MSRPTWPATPASKRRSSSALATSWRAPARAPWCDGFERLRADSPAPERAYADYLAGRIAPPDVPLLPPQHRAAAAGDAAAVRAIEDPLSRLIAAGVLFRSGQASPQVLVLATETASAQGWRRPLLAWLGVQAARAEQAGAAEEAQRIRRRMALAAGER
jgi:hypothetical protein